MNDQPRIITFQSIGDNEIGYLSVASRQHDIPFEIRRVFWTYSTPVEIVRGHHAHREVEQVMIATSGIVNVMLEDPEGNKQSIILDRQDKGLYVPCHFWRTMTFSEGAVLLVLASHDYDASEYIRDYDEFKSGTGSK